MSLDLSKLNEEQLAPVLQTEGAVMVVAGAGSGKTRVLTHRIAHLMIDQGVSPYNILAITFTNKAANEMKERLVSMVSDIHGMWVFTFHAMCVRILRQFIDKIGFTKNFSIYGEAEKESTIKKIIKAKNQKDSEDIDVDEFAKKATRLISDAKNQGLSPDEYLAENKFKDDIDDLCDVYSLYQKSLNECNALDYDDLLVNAYKLLVKCDEAREYFQERFKYIHVDEFQDTNIIQYKLVKLLSGKHKNVMVVGDEDQCIYGWRGACINNLFDFKKDFDCTTYKLERNYRSTKAILNLANQLIVKNFARMDKTLWTEKEDGTSVETFVASSEINEAEYVAYCINNLVSEGYSLNEMAILMRVNALTRAFEEKMMQYGIPYKIFGGTKFYERKEIKDILAYLKILVNPNDDEAILRVINFPRRGIGDKAIFGVREYAENHKMRLYDVIMNIETTSLSSAIVNKIASFTSVIRELNVIAINNTVENIVKGLVKLINLKEVFQENTEENNNRKLNIANFVQSINSYVESYGDISLEEYLQYLSLYSDIDGMDEGNNSVSIATVHSCKGLEFKVVFVVGLEDGIFPTQRSFDSTSDMEEERRLMYVAITRAMERLYFTYATKRFLYGGTRYTIPSRFLKELDIVKPKPVIVRQSTFVSREVPNPNRAFKPIQTEIVKNNIDDKKYVIGTKVFHKKFGQGVITELVAEASGLCAQINFESRGSMTLSLSYAPLEIIE